MNLAAKQLRAVARILCKRAGWDIETLDLDKQYTWTQLAVDILKELEPEIQPPPPPPPTIQTGDIFQQYDKRFVLTYQCDGYQGLMWHAIEYQCEVVRDRYGYSGISAWRLPPEREAGPDRNATTIVFPHVLRRDGWKYIPKDKA